MQPDSPLFYPLTIALAATWVIGGFASGPLHLGRINFRGELRRPIIIPVLLGLVTAVVFIFGALIVREIEPLRASTENVLAFARYQSLPLVALITVMNGIAEEIFFRGALFAAIGTWHPVLISTLIYSLTTVATGNPMLVFSAVMLGVLLGSAATIQRRNPWADPHPLHVVADHAAGAATSFRGRWILGPKTLTSHSSPSRTMNAVQALRASHRLCVRSLHERCR